MYLATYSAYQLYCIFLWNYVNTFVFRDDYVPPLSLSLSS